MRYPVQSNPLKPRLTIRFCASYDWNGDVHAPLEVSSDITRRVPEKVREKCSQCCQEQYQAVNIKVEDGLLDWYLLCLLVQADVADSTVFTHARERAFEASRRAICPPWAAHWGGHARGEEPDVLTARAIRLKPLVGCR